jgi:hypothetical protein
LCRFDGSGPPLELVPGRGASRLQAADNGTIVAGDWSNVDGGYFGLSLADIAKALEP